MAITAGMTSAIMNPVALPIGPKKLQAKLDELAAAGIIVPDNIDMELLANITGMGSTKSKSRKGNGSYKSSKFLNKQ